MKLELFCSLTGSVPEKLQLRVVFLFFLFFSPDKKLKQARQLLQLTVNAAGFKCFGTPQFEC